MSQGEKKPAASRAPEGEPESVRTGQRTDLRRGGPNPAEALPIGGMATPAQPLEPGRVVPRPEPGGQDLVVDRIAPHQRINSGPFTYPDLDALGAPRRDVLGRAQPGAPPEFQPPPVLMPGPPDSASSGAGSAPAITTEASQQSPPEPAEAPGPQEEPAR